METKKRKIEEGEEKSGDHHDGEKKEHPYIPFSIQHIDIPCKDLTRASTFYEKVFNWKTEATGFPFYRLWKPPGGGVEGGFYSFEGDAVPAKGVGLHITVDEIEPVLEKVKEHGGTVVKEKFLIGEGIGWNAFFKDTEGNEIGVYSPPEERKKKKEESK